MEYRENATGQFEPLVEYTSDPYEKELMKKPIGHYGELWQTYIENQFPFWKKAQYINAFVWPIIPRIIDIRAELRFAELDERYRKEHPAPSGDDFRESERWNASRTSHIEKRIMEEIVNVDYDRNDDYGKICKDLLSKIKAE